MQSPKQLMSPRRKAALIKLAKMKPEDRTRLLKLEALRRGIEPKTRKKD